MRKFRLVFAISVILILGGIILHQRRPSPQMNKALELRSRSFAESPNALNLPKARTQDQNESSANPHEVAEKLKELEPELSDPETIQALNDQTASVKMRENYAHKLADANLLRKQLSEAELAEAETAFNKLRQNHEVRLNGFRVALDRILNEE